ncbi:MAG TPA: DUF805 domain-containing protein [Caulobacteraceae bacterium]|jgi:uncharacterized membrane protein YhaH (DUF805 family)
MMQLLFNFNGRIRRSTYWLAALGAGLAYGVVLGLCIAIMAMGRDGPLGMVGGLLCLVVYVFLIWTGLALQIKRWHDRDKSWTWIFIAFIPFVGAIWSLVECGFLDGTPGPNKYGPSPKGLTGAAVSPAI